MTSIDIAHELTLKAAEAMLSDENLYRLLDSRRRTKRNLSGIRSLYVDGQKASICGTFDGGGTKEVHDIKIKEDHYALGISGTNDIVDITRTKWEKALREPTHTAQLRGYGLKVNDLSRLVAAKINGIYFPAILMIRYQDHDFPIYDRKNFQRNNNSLIKLDDVIDEKRFIDMMSPLLEDITVLAAHKIVLGSYCFNLCMIDCKPRIYLNDLGAMGRIENDVGQYIKKYVEYTIGAMLHSLGEDVFRKHPFIKRLTENTGLEDRLIEKAYDKVMMMKPLTQQTL